MRLLAALGWSLLATTSTLAEDQLAAMSRAAFAKLAGTISVKSSPVMSSGQLSGCSLEFEHVQQDFVYLNGDFIRSSGSVAVMATSTNDLGILMKVVATEIDPGKQPIEATPLQISRVYLMTHDMASNFASMAASMPAEVEGGLVTVFPMDPSLPMLMEEVGRGTLTFAVGLSGATDIQLPVDLNVSGMDDNGVRTMSTDALLGFFECSKTLMGRLVE